MVDPRWQMLARRSRAVAKDVRSFATAVVEAILIVTFGVQVVRVDGFSMAPTLGNHWGLVPKKYIVGKVMLRWWPVRDMKLC